MPADSEKFSVNAKDVSAKKEIVSSPCVSICALDDEDVCIGCFRSGHEITQWGRLDNEGKRAILRNVEARLTKQQ